MKKLFFGTLFLTLILVFCLAISAEGEIGPNGQNVTNGKFSWTFDEASGVLNIVSDVTDPNAWNELKVTENSEFVAWKAVYGSKVKVINVNSAFGKFATDINTASAASMGALFANMPLLETVNFNPGSKRWSEYSGIVGGTFSGNKYLKTFGWNGNLETGVVDLTGVKLESDGFDDMFSECESIVEVIFNIDAVGHPYVYKNMFYGCTSLKRITSVLMLPLSRMPLLQDAVRLQRFILMQADLLLRELLSLQTAI